MKVLVLGADGFIGRHIAFGLRAAGHEVLACARRVERLEAMGFRCLKADLHDDQCHDVSFWQKHLQGKAVVNAAGLLTGTEATFEAVHVKALHAVLAARGAAPAVHVSAVGIEADTPFARWRRASEQVAAEAGAVVLRPGLVLANTSYGGSSALRAFAALPFALPVVGDGAQPFNPIHAADLAQVVAEVLANPPGPGPWEIGGPEVLTQAEVAQGLRRWMGLQPVPLWRVPPRLARCAGRIGDLFGIGPISTTALKQLDQGVLADPAPLLARLTTRPRGFTAFQLFAHPAGTQDLWQARLYLLKPLVRLVLALMWLASAALGLFTPTGDFLARLGSMPEALALPLARIGGLVDLGLALALLRNWQPLRIAQAQIAVVAGYTLGLTIFAPGLWLDPFGGLLKNLPILALLLLHLALVEER